jgi:hypothetical protein
LWVLCAWGLQYTIADPGFSVRVSEKVHIPAVQTMGQRDGEGYGLGTEGYGVPYHHEEIAGAGKVLLNESHEGIWAAAEAARLLARRFQEHLRAVIIAAASATEIA